LVVIRRLLRRGLSRHRSTVFDAPSREAEEHSKLGFGGQEAETRDSLEDAVVGYQRNPEANRRCRDPEIADVVLGGECVASLPTVGPKLRTYRNRAAVRLDYWVRAQVTLQPALMAPKRSSIAV
jgi:hypothetical protein